MNEKVREYDAKQGRSGKRVLIIMVASLALMGIAWLIYEGFSGNEGLDGQAVAPTGEATTIETPAANDATVPANSAVTSDGEVVTVPVPETPALATGAEETPNADTAVPAVTPEPTGN